MVFTLDFQKTNKFSALFTHQRKAILDALVEGIKAEDKKDVRELLENCMDTISFQSHLKLVLPIVRRTVIVPNWRQFVTIENLNVFLMNPHIYKEHLFCIDFEAEFLALLAICFISEYNANPERHSPSWWMDECKINEY